MRGLAVLLLLCLAVFSGPAAVLVPGPVSAQAALGEQDSDSALDYVDWESVAQRAEEALDAGRASTSALEKLRAELATWRAAFVSAEDRNEARISTVLNQIAALGPAPAEGEADPPEVATRREQLNTLLAELRVPSRRATEAHTRAEGLIHEIDGVIRERQAEALLERVRSPLNPAGWSPALLQLQATFAGIGAEIERNWSNPVRRAALRDDLPITLTLFIVAVVLLLRGRSWMERLTISVFERLGSRVAGLALSTGQVIVPTAGILLLVASLESTGLVGFRSSALVNALPLPVFYFYSGLWIAGRLFPKRGEPLLSGSLSAERRRAVRRNAGALGLVLGIGGVLNAAIQQDNYSAAEEAVLFFPFNLVLGLLLFRLGRLLFIYARGEQPGGGPGTFDRSILSFIARGAKVLGVTGPLLAAAGYQSAASYTVVPAAMTLGLIGLVAILNRLVLDLYALVTGSSEEEAHAALLPTLVAILISVGALPLLALIWGARVADLSEFWNRFREGYALGETRISPTDFLIVIVVFAGGYAATRLAQSALKMSILPKTRLDVGARNAVVSGFGYVGIFLAALAAITAAGIDLSSLALVAGALSVGLGFGLQNVVQNFVAGIILLIERPIGEGDWVEVGSTMGIVKSISVRSTTIETFDKTNVIVPNADFISAQVINWTRGTLTGRLIVPVGVAYGTDTRKVDRILTEIAEAQPLVVVDPPPMILFAGFGADALEFEVRVILRDVNFILRVKNEINHQIAQRFAEEGIEIPFAQRDIWLRNPEALSGAGGKPTDLTPGAGDAAAERAPEDVPDPTPEEAGKPR